MASLSPSTSHHLSLPSILHTLSQTPHRLRKRMLVTTTPDQELNQVRGRSGAVMKRKLQWYDLVVLGVGGMLGAGVFFTTGNHARKVSRPRCTLGLDDPKSGRLEVGGLAEGYNTVDLLAAILVLLLTVCLCQSTKESSMLNLVMGVIHVIFFGFVIVAGFYNGSSRNLIQSKELAPFGVRGILDGATIVYFSYIGYYSMSIMAEEIKNPLKSIPIGIAGSVLIVSAFNCLMSLALCSMIPYNEISENASFSSAFQQKMGWKWTNNIVGGGASLGIVASLFVAMLGQARYMCHARARLG